MTRHKHKWGSWIGRRCTRPASAKCGGIHHYRLCIEGWCGAGQHRNGRVYVARPDRQRIAALRGEEAKP